MTPGQKAARTRKRRAAGAKAARTRKLRAAGKKAALTRKHRAAGRKAAETRMRNAAAASIRTGVLSTAYLFRSTVRRGEAKGQPMEAFKDERDNYVLLDPSKRRDGSVLATTYTFTSSSTVAASLIMERGYSMRMRPRSGRVAASMVQAKRIEIIDLSTGAVIWPRAKVEAVSRSM